MGFNSELKGLIVAFIHPLSSLTAHDIRTQYHTSSQLFLQRTITWQGQDTHLVCEQYVNCFHVRGIFQYKTLRRMWRSVELFPRQCDTKRSIFWYSSHCWNVTGLHYINSRPKDGTLHTRQLRQVAKAGAVVSSTWLQRTVSYSTVSACFTSWPVHGANSIFPISCCVSITRISPTFSPLFQPAILSYPESFTLYGTAVTIVRPSWAFG
jgi:hypothetical protein